jgi:hypothetical protein
MAAYIHPDNQSVLWKAISSSPLFTSSSLPIKQEEWFKRIIQNVYNNSKEHLTNSELQQLNRDTITYMMNELKTMTKQSTIGTQPLSPAQPSYTNHLLDEPTASISTRSNERETVLSQQFNERQKEYESMLSKEPIKEVDFKTSAVADEPITNMDELMKRHMKERENELVFYTPEPPTTIKIDSSNIELVPDIQTSPNHKKNVHWGNNSTVEPEDDTTQTQINKLFEVINDLKKQIEEVKQLYTSNTT